MKWARAACFRELLRPRHYVVQVAVYQAPDSHACACHVTASYLQVWISLFLLFMPSELRSPTTQNALRVLRCAFFAFLWQGPGSCLVAVAAAAGAVVIGLASRALVAIFRILFYGILSRVWGVLVQHFPAVKAGVDRLRGHRSSRGHKGIASPSMYKSQAQIVPTAHSVPPTPLGGAGGGAGAGGGRAGAAGGTAGADDDGMAPMDEFSALTSHLGKGLWHRFVAHGHNGELLLCIQTPTHIVAFTCLHMLRAASSSGSLCSALRTQSAAPACVLSASSVAFALCSGHRQGTGLGQGLHKHLLPQGAAAGGVRGGARPRQARSPARHQSAGEAAERAGRAPQRVRLPRAARLHPVQVELREYAWCGRVSAERNAVCALCVHHPGMTKAMPHFAPGFPEHTSCQQTRNVKPPQFTKFFIIFQFLLHLTYMSVFIAYAFTIKDM